VLQTGSLLDIFPQHQLVRLRQSAQRLQLSIVETRRGRWQGSSRDIASLGSIRPTLSIADRIEFWARLHQRLERLSNRINAEALEQILGGVHDRIPTLTAAAAGCHRG
jgi:hypothetical protein